MQTRQSCINFFALKQWNIHQPCKHLFTALAYSRTIVSGAANLDGYKLIWVTFLALIAAGIVIFVLSGVVLAVFGHRQRNKPMLIAGAVAVALPLLGFAWSSLSADWAYNDRKREIARMKRHPLPVDHPRTAIVLGGGTQGALDAYMVLGYLDEIRSADSHPSGSFSLGPATVPVLPISPEYRAIAYGYLQNIIYDNPAFSTTYVELRPCLNEVSMKGGDGDLPDDAIMIRRDLDALNRKPRRKVWSNGIVEISVRRKGRDTLIDYEEKPLIKKLYSPLTPLSEDLETGFAPDPDRMIIRMFGLPPPVTEPNG